MKVQHKQTDNSTAGVTHKHLWCRHCGLGVHGILQERQSSLQVRLYPRHFLRTLDDVRLMKHEHRITTLTYCHQCHITIIFTMSHMKTSWNQEPCLSVVSPDEHTPSNDVNSETHQYESEEGLVLSCVIQSLFEQVWVDGTLGVLCVLLTDLLQQGRVLPGQALRSCQLILYICGRGRHRLVQDGRHCRRETHMEKWALTPRSVRVNSGDPRTVLDALSSFPAVLVEEAYAADDQSEFTQLLLFVLFQQRHEGRQLRLRKDALQGRCNKHTPHTTSCCFLKLP